MKTKNIIIKDDMLYCDGEIEGEHDFIISNQERKESIKRFMFSLQQKINDNSNEKLPKPIEVEIMKQLGIERYCCKRHLIGHVDILNIL